MTELPIADEQLARRLRDKLVELGVSDEDLGGAASGGIDALRRLMARHISFPGARRYTSAEVYAKSGTDDETARSLWLAMGFAEVPDGEAAFTDQDVEALQSACRLFERTQMDRAIVLQQTRSMGQAAARVAAAQLDVISDVIPRDDPAAAAAAALRLADETLPVLDRLLVYMYRRHLAAATEQRLLLAPTEEGAVIMSVGFADLSGYTALSLELDVRELAHVIDRFNAATTDAIARGGGRVVKTIGDEVMFATPDPAAAASIAAALIADVSGANELPPLKVGLAMGGVIPREGDMFGAPVNLANRLVTAARPHSVLVDEATAEALSGDERFTFSPAGRRYMKGFGHVRSYRLRRAGERS